MASDLLTLSEIAVALCGFASIVVLFRRAPNGLWSRTTAYGFRDMITVALGAAFWSALPFVAMQFGANAPSWKLLCGVFGVAQLVGTGGVVATRIGNLGPPPVSYVAIGSLSGHALTAVALLLSAFGVLPWPPQATYVASIAWLLLGVGGWFLYLVAIPESAIARDERFGAEGEQPAAACAPPPDAR